MKKIKFLIIGLLMFLPGFVYATNDVDYTLTITDDFKFKEVIKYSISDYKHKQNGYNPFATIVEDEDIEVDILDKTKYKKSKVYKNGKYYVILSYTYSEYSLSNSILLNDCFENSDYDYNIDSYSFNGNGGFYCLKGDSLKITIITDKQVKYSNATVIGNRYIWEPKDNDFEMKFEMNKEYTENEELKEVERIGSTHSDEITDNKTNNVPDNEKDKTSQKEKKPINIKVIGIISGIVLIFGIITFIVLSQKKKNLNRL